MKADLHIHSKHSDGINSVDELITYALEKQLDVIAITDHDSVEAYKDIKNNQKDILVLIGVELSTDFNNEDIHILGYFYNNEEPSNELKDILKTLSEKRKERVYKVIELLKSNFDIEITYEEIASFADGTIGRPHIAMAVEKKYNIPFRTIFDNYIGEGKKAYVPTEKFETKEAIDILKNNNALVVLAHPIKIIKNNVDDLLKLGIDGIEVRYSENNKEETDYYYNLAKNNNLIITGGSDFHGINVVSDMGTGYIEDKELEEFLTKLKIKK